MANTILEPTSGQRIPVTIDLNIKPLMHLHEPVRNGNGRLMMDNEWVYVYMPGYGQKAINVNRANYCKKIYLQNTLIIDSFKGKADKTLLRFINEVADTLVFKHNGTNYRVYLTYWHGVYSLLKVTKFWGETYDGGRDVWAIAAKKYGHDAQRPAKNAVNLLETFGFKLL